MTTPTMTWTRLTRRLRDDHNPLRRRSDRVEAWLLPAVLAAFLVLAPLVAGATIWLVHAANAADTSAQRALRPAPAVLLAAAPGPMHRHGSSWLAWTPARWTVGGVTRTGLIPVGAGTPAGSRVRVWLTRSGQVRLPPLTPGVARARGLFSASLALAALACALALAALVGRWRLNRGRLSDWAADWLAVEPQWSHLK
jgi:hypothetical protein